MSNLIQNSLIFAAGLLVGAFVDQILLKKKFEERLNKELDEIKVYKEHETDIPDEHREIEVKKVKALKNSGYSTDEIATVLGHKDTKVRARKESIPYAITPEEYQEEEGYHSATLYYYEEDEVLTDEGDNEIDDPNEIIGEGALDIFVYTNAESCFIRNDAKRCDYEIVKCEGSYAEAMEDKDG